MLCYEQNTEFCHRHIVVARFEILLGVNVPEAKARDYEKEEQLENVVDEVKIEYNKEQNIKQLVKIKNI